MTTNPLSIVNAIEKLDERALEDLSIFPESVLSGIYYHLTNTSFLEFSLEKRGENTEYHNAVHGFFFTDEKGLEKLKRDNPDTFGEVILKVKLDIKKPINFTFHSIFTDETQAPTIWETISGERKTGKEALELLNENIGLGEIGEMQEHLSSEEFIEFVKKDGYDGIISHLGDNHLEFVAFRPEQVQILTKEALAKAYQEGRNKQLMDSLEKIIPKKRQRISF